MNHPAPGRLYREALLLERDGELATLGSVQTHDHWSNSTRHKTGAFYTPPQLVAFIVKRTLLPVVQELADKARTSLRQADLAAYAEVVAEAERLQVVDPACGCGRFLLVAFRVLRDLHVWLAKREAKLAKTTGPQSQQYSAISTEQPPKDTWLVGTLRALSCLQGKDLNPQAVAVSRSVLLHAAGLDDASTPVAKRTATLGRRHAVMGEAGHQLELSFTDNALDSIIGLSKVRTVNLFDETEQTTTEHQHISATGNDQTGAHETTPFEGRQPNWNVVIGNPPWGAAGAEANIARKLGLPAANVNTFGLFLTYCLNQLAPGGRLGFVLPRNFCKGNDYALIRTKMLESTALEWLVDAGKAFPGVTQETVVIVARRLFSGENAGITQLMKLETTDSTLYIEGKARCIPQTTFLQRPSAVITLSADREHYLILKKMEEASESVLREKATWIRGLEYGQDGALTRCPDCGMYTSLPKKKREQKPCDGCGHTLQAGSVDYRLITHVYDKAHRIPIYVGRHVRRYTLSPPYWIDPDVPGVRYKDPQLFLGPKIVLPKIAPFLAAAVDFTDTWTTQGVYTLRPKEVNWDIYLLLGLLNSAPFAFYYQFRFNDGAQLTTNVTLTNLLQLPLPPIEGNGTEAHTQIIQDCVRQLVGEPQIDPSMATKLNNDIDTAVCHLYRMSDQEASLVTDWWHDQPI